MTARRPASGEQPEAFERGTEIGDPVGEQVVEDRIQLLFGRIPWLQQVIVQTNSIDGAQRGIDVGVCGQQYAFGRRVQRKGLFQELHA